MKTILLMLISTFMITTLYASDGVIVCYQVDNESSLTYELFRFNSFGLKRSGESYKAHLDTIYGKDYFLEVYLYDEYNRTFVMRVNEGSFEDFSEIESKYILEDEYVYMGENIPYSYSMTSSENQLNVWCSHSTISI